MQSPTYIWIKRNEEADEATKPAIDIWGITTTRLPYTDYYTTMMKDRNSEWQKKWKNNTNKLHYIKSRIEEWESAQKGYRQLRLNWVCLYCTLD